MKRIGIFCFTRNLRLHDNTLLTRATSECEQIAFIYIKPEVSNFHRHFSPHVNQGQASLSFEVQSVKNLRVNLGDQGQVLLGYQGKRSIVLNTLLELNPEITDVYFADGSDWELRQLKEYLRNKHASLDIHAKCNNQLFEYNEFPFDLSELPKTFTSFRKKAEDLPVLLPLNEASLNAIARFDLNDQGLTAWDEDVANIEFQFLGGESEGHEHLASYFNTPRALSYKETRNHFDDWTHSTAFSLWLAWGCITPRQILTQLRQYEHRHGSNDSTYWIYFELLWREYFRLYALKHGRKLFAFKGITDKRPLTTFYTQPYRSWCEGNTGFPVVDACMKQLNQTGMMSNRGRQLVASCFVHELGLDWRFGAAYFEAMLIDYDVSSNWGNWQYLAGVGADPRGHRKFDLDKQQQWYDPKGKFISRWNEN
ncbi:DASH family cryptochrome [Vibrio astriarenae]|uniref:Cryptochrome DASH n=1 Tax=Vibrio astriarenae TaxID=1481923 RepID=A0A7Z2T6L3_9VIBR|nr:DASH family cryptochrome [Vibrio astriarenae]QIA65201.1 DASH family cryptochrome [Vibrio astriarenae]